MSENLALLDDDDESYVYWTPIEFAPHGEEVLLWLKADMGAEAPIGAVVGKYQESEFWHGWVEKSVAGGYNLGLRQDLVTHFKYLDKGPPNE